MNPHQRASIFAHRGANREAAENTRSAFDRALAYPIDGIETDIQLTRDGVAVLWHDRFLDKLGIKNKRIDDFDHAELRAMNFAAHFAGNAPHPTHNLQAGNVGCIPCTMVREAHPTARSMGFNSGEENWRPGSLPHAGEGTHEGVMSLREFLNAYRSRCRLLLEIKNRDWEHAERHEAKVRQTLELVGDAKDDVLISSFNLASLIYAHSLRPDFPLVLNLEPEHDAAFAAAMLDAHPFLHGLCVSIETLYEPMVETVRAQGKTLAVYTCNSDEEIARALDLGVDVLISDVPQKALALRDR